MSWGRLRNPKKAQVLGEAGGRILGPRPLEGRTLVDFFVVENGEELSRARSGSEHVH